MAATTGPARTAAAGGGGGGGPALPALSGTLRTAVVAVPLTTAALVATAVPAAAALSPGLAATAGPLLLLAAVVVGLPHGAVDLLQPELTPRSRRGRSVVGLAYVGLVVVAVLALRLAPLPVLGLLLVLAAVHFGLADEVVHRWRTGRLDGERTSTGRLGTLARVVGLGGVPVAVPLAAGDERVGRLLDTLAGGSGEAVRAGAQAALWPVGTAVALTVLVGLLRRDVVGAGEPLVLTALFVLVPPLPAFAAYFGLWHSLRHLARLLALDALRHRPDTPADAVTDGAGRAPQLGAGELWGAAAHFLRAAAMPTGLALAGLVVLVVGAGDDVVPAALVLVLCLTVPHAAAVSLADRGLRRT